MKTKYLLLLNIIIFSEAKANLEKIFNLNELFDSEEIKEINSDQNITFNNKILDKIKNFCSKFGFTKSSLIKKDLNNSQKYLIVCSSEDNKSFDFASSCSDQSLDINKSSAQSLINVLEKIKNDSSLSELDMKKWVDGLFPSKNQPGFHGLEDKTIPTHREIRYHFNLDYYDQDRLIDDMERYYFQKLSYLKNLEKNNAVEKDIEKTIDMLKIISKNNKGVCAGLSCVWVYGKKISDLKSLGKNSRIPSIEVQKK